MILGVTAGVKRGLRSLMVDALRGLALWAWLMAQGAVGALSPLVGAVVPLHQVREAHAMLEQGSISGKIVLQP